MNKERYVSLDGLRAYAAIGILLMHVQANVPDWPSGGFFFDTFIPSLTHFVYLFIVISAFALCCGYYDRVKCNQITPNDFYKKRYSRILPFFAILVVIDLVIPHGPNKYEMVNMTGEIATGITAVKFSLYDAFAQLTLCFNLLPNPQPTIGVAWFLGVIFLFYLLFPFFVFMMDNKKRAWISLVLCYLFAFMAVDYFLTDHFINWKMSRHCIVYDAPFLAWGGVVYLYKDDIKRIVTEYRWLTLVICAALTCGYWFVPFLRGKYMFILTMSFITTAWLCYAIGTSGIVLNNRVVKYLSGISMEIYLCHMMCYRAVGFIHIEKFIGNIYWVYAISCFLTLAVAICFSHVMKYWGLPMLERCLKMVFKKNKN